MVTRAAVRRRDPARRPTRGGRQRGFTLIELMIVVGIVAVLASAAIPAFRRYIRRARNVEGLHNIQKLADSAIGYYEAHSRLPAQVEGGPVFFGGVAIAPFTNMASYCDNLVWPAGASADFNKGLDGRVWNGLKFQPEGNLRFYYAAEMWGQSNPPWVDSYLWAIRHQYQGCATVGGYQGIYYRTQLNLASDNTLRAKGPRKRRF